MRAKSDNLRSTKPKPSGRRRHLPYEARRAQILEKAIVFFSEYGLTGQTRHLAAACGVSQRLLYRYFPNKAALLDEVYREAIAKPYDETWLEDLRQPAAPLRARLYTFYTRYAANVITRRWLRLFLYSALGENPMARVYDDTVVQHILDVVVETSARDLGLTLPGRAAERRRMAWSLHGAIVMSGIRVHVYGISSETVWRREIAAHIDSYLAALPALCRTTEAEPGKSPLSAAKRDRSRAS
jgi:AcrR family transcriptional regulator